MATNSTTVNRQNKLLLVSLVIIIAASVVLVTLTGSANKKKTDEKPPVETQNETTVGDKRTSDKQSTVKSGDIKQNESTTGGKKTEEKDQDVKKETEEKTEKTKKPETAPDKESEKNNKVENTEETAETSVIENDFLPVFSSPVESIVIKGVSLEVPVFSYTMNDYRTHSGLDYACSPGTPVCAAADGTVKSVSSDPMMGVTVSLTHSGGAETRYKGLSEETLSMVSAGDEGKSGDVIGVSGETALIESAEENHVHFELSVNGEVKDPAEYVSVVFLSDLTED